MPEWLTVLAVWLATSLLVAAAWSITATLIKRSARQGPKPMDVADLLDVADLSDEELDLVHDSARLVVARTHMEQQRRQAVRDAEIAALEQQWRQS